MPPTHGIGVRLAAQEVWKWMSRRGAMIPRNKGSEQKELVPDDVSSPAEATGMYSKQAKKTYKEVLSGSSRPSIRVTSVNLDDISLRDDDSSRASTVLNDKTIDERNDEEDSEDEANQFYKVNRNVILGYKHNSNRDSNMLWKSRSSRNSRNSIR